MPLVSLGLLSHKGWRTQALNPANFSVTTHELQDVAGPFYSLRYAHPIGSASATDPVSPCCTGQTGSVPKLLPVCSRCWNEATRSDVRDQRPCCKNTPP